MRYPLVKHLLWGSLHHSYVNSSLMHLLLVHHMFNISWHLECLQLPLCVGHDYCPLSVFNGFLSSLALFSFDTDIKPLLKSLKHRILLQCLFRVEWISLYILIMLPLLPYVIDPPQVLIVIDLPLIIVEQYVLCEFISR